MPTAPPRSCGALRVLLDGLTGQFVEGVLAGGQLSGRSCLCVADPVSSVNRKPSSRAETRSHSDADEFRPVRSGRATSPLPAKGPAFPPGQGVLTPMWERVSARERAWPFPPGQGVLIPMWERVSAREGPGLPTWAGRTHTNVGTGLCPRRGLACLPRSLRPTQHPRADSRPNARPAQPAADWPPHTAQRPRRSLRAAMRGHGNSPARVVRRGRCAG